VVVCWLPIVDTSRTLRIAPPPDVLAGFKRSIRLGRWLNVAPSILRRLRRSSPTSTRKVLHRKRAYCHRRGRCRPTGSADLIDPRSTRVAVRGAAGFRLRCGPEGPRSERGEGGLFDAEGTTGQEYRDGSRDRADTGCFLTTELSFDHGRKSCLSLSASAMPLRRALFRAAGERIRTA